jgi:predicted SAM-dependent methyltransferase
MLSMSDVLDLGCGQRKFPGSTGIDILPASGVDIVHDLNLLPWPLEENRFDVVLCSHVLEHLADVVATLNEVHRVSRNGARVKIVTPHFSSLNSWEDPTHRYHFARRSFSFFDTTNPHCYTNRRMRTVSVEVAFGGGLWDWLGRMQYGCCPELWEKHFAFLWRARNLFVELEVIKS